MSVKVRFYKMTRPPKFRRFRMIIQYLKDWWQGVSSVIYNRSLFILYKYKLFNIKRYSYRDNGEEVFPAPLYFRRGIQTTNFKAIIEMNLVERWNIDLEYYYREQKDGSKKILLVLSDFEEKKLLTDSRLKEICISIDGKEYYQLRDRQPVFEYRSIIPPLRPFNDTEVIKTSKDVYDMNILYNARQVNLVSTEKKHDEVAPEELVSCYDFAVSEFKYWLSKLSLEDLRVNGEPRETTKHTFRSVQVS